jgi:hypothetical protein
VLSRNEPMTTEIENELTGSEFLALYIAQTGTSALFASLRFISRFLEAHEQHMLPGADEGEPQRIRAPIFNTEVRRTQRGRH